MHITALLPVLALLVPAISATAIPRDVSEPAVVKRVAKRVCRARTSTSAAASSAAAASPIVSVGVDVGVAVPSASAVATAAPSPSAAAPAPSASPAAPSPSASPAAPSPSANTGSGSGNSNNGANAASLTPNGKKAGISAGNALQAMGSHIGWWYNWAPTEEYAHSDTTKFVPTLWGGGNADATDAARLATFKSLTSTPEWIIGMNEPDCAAGSMSSGMSVDATAALWNELMVPKGQAGSLLLSPSMCKQMAEDGWLRQFQAKISRDFDITNVHINKNNIQGVKDSLDYYWNTYKKPIWVTEFACVNDVNGFVPCTDQGQINSYIQQVVDLFEADERVYAYAFSNGYGLGDVWPMWSGNGLSQSGQTYLNAISKYH